MKSESPIHAESPANAAAKFRKRSGILAPLFSFRGRLFIAFLFVGFVFLAAAGAIALLCYAELPPPLMGFCILAVHGLVLGVAWFVAGVVMKPLEDLGQKVFVASTAIRAKTEEIAASLRKVVEPGGTTNNGGRGGKHGMDCRRN